MNTEKQAVYSFCKYILRDKFAQGKTYMLHDIYLGQLKTRLCSSATVKYMDFSANEGHQSLAAAENARLTATLTVTISHTTTLITIPIPMEILLYVNDSLEDNTASLYLPAE